jgi:hypothetical protein
MESKMTASKTYRDARGAYPFDRGRRAALNGLSKRNNPFDNLESSRQSTMILERKASEWDDGWWTGYYEKLELDKK